MLDLEPIKKLCDAATPGPWYLDDDGGITDADGFAVAHVAHHGNVNTVVREGEHFSGNDGRFITASPVLFRQLVAEVERLRAVNSALRNNLISQEEMEAERKAKFEAALKKTNEKFGSVLERLAE